LSGIWKRQDELERRLRRERPAPPAPLVNELLQRIEATHAQRERSFRVGLAAAASVGMLIALAGFGGLGYAASSVQHAVRAAVHAVTPTQKQASDQPQLNSAAAQYGNKALVCAVTPNGKQHTISISENAVPNYLRTHPQAFLGSCGAFRPRGAKPNVCLRLATGKFVPIWVRPSIVTTYLKRNYLSHRSKNGLC
jgi:hypothetical protein